MSVVAHNPIMPGFYPDPSFVAVGEDFYMVNSTFAYFPGLPVLHSKDLAHWEQIGNVLDRNSQLVLGEAKHSAGLFAPTIRYYDGTFYVICTNVTFGGNFIVTAKNPEGPWSEPHYIEGADGIDPSLFFDCDGTCYYIGTHPNPEGCKYNGDWYIWIQQLDVDKMELIGEAKNVWNGAMRNIIWPEGPHLYKKDDYYYIMHAEGGTGPDHAVTICRSKNVFGPYENNFCNPILTHRHLGQDYPIKYVGHADIAQTVNGEWYMIMLGVRPLKGYTTMGRETFIAKVIWENGWPVVNPSVGMLTKEVTVELDEWDPAKDPSSYTARTMGKTCIPGSDRQYDFTKRKELGDEFLHLRNNTEEMYQLGEEGLLLSFRKETLKDLKCPSYLAIRQQHHNYDAKVTLSLATLTEGRCAGMAIVQNNDYHVRVEIGDGKVELILCENGRDKVLTRVGISELPIQDNQITLLFQQRGLGLNVRIQGSNGDYGLLGELDISDLSTEVAGGFVGCTIGMYAVAHAKKCEGAACFESFCYEHKE